MPRSDSIRRRQRRMRQEWREKGKCSDCGGERSTEDGSLCAKCTKRRITQQAVNRKKASKNIAEMAKQLGTYYPKEEGENKL